MKRDELVALADTMVKRLRNQEPGTRAMLRRGLGRPPEDIANFHAHAEVSRFLPERPDRATERAFYTVAALIAAQPRGARDQEREQVEDTDHGGDVLDADDATADSMSAVNTEPSPAASTSSEPSTTAEPQPTPEAARRRRNLGQTLAWAVVNGHMKGDMVRNRLHLLARYRLDRLHRELPKLVAHLRADLVPIDWGYLLRDLSRWDRERAQVGKEWVQQYHRAHDQLQRARKRDDDAPTGP